MDTLLRRRAALVVLGMVLCAALSQIVYGRIRTQDSNDDGRPDVWRTYNSRGQLTAVRVDTDFDGVSDVEEYYERGALIRRESDRDHDGRVDLVEEFDPATHEHNRSVVDVDRDGIADLLVLFQGGRPVLTKWEHPAGTAWTQSAGVSACRCAVRGWASDRLTPLTDPFRAKTAIRGALAPTRTDISVAVSVAGPIPDACVTSVPLARSGAPDPGDVQTRSLTVLLQPSPRGPPLVYS